MLEKSQHYEPDYRNNSRRHETKTHENDNNLMRTERERDH